MSLCNFFAPHYCATIFPGFKTITKIMSRKSPELQLLVEKALNLNDIKRLSTGCFEIDQCLRGGLPTKGIVEISGESGSGKSQLCMQLALTVQYPESAGGLNGGAAYICTEEHFQSKRLQQLIENFPHQYYRQRSSDIPFSNNIFIEHLADFENLVHCLTKRVPLLINSRNIKLIILDSIAAIFRGSYQMSEGRKRTNDLRLVGHIFHKLCSDSGIMTVCVNQVSQVLSSAENIPVPALGLAWANMVTTRLQLFRCVDGSRQLKVLFAPDLPTKTTNFTIKNWGVGDT